MAEILIVEDYPPILSLLSRLFMSQGHCVTRELCVAGALRHACTFDHAILDIDLPDGDGVSLAELLQTTHRVKDIMFFTGTRDAALLARAARLGRVVDKTTGAQTLLAQFQHRTNVSGLHCRGAAVDDCPSSRVLELGLDASPAQPQLGPISRCS